MMVLYEGEGFRIMDDDGVRVFKIDVETSEISYDFLTGAIEEYERSDKSKEYT